jgi:hypothetical protein
VKKVKKTVNVAPLDALRRALGDTIADQSIDGDARFAARLRLAHLNAIEKCLAEAPEFLDKGPGRQRLDRDTTVAFLLRNAIDSASSPIMTDDERNQIIDAAALVMDGVSCGDPSRMMVGAWQIGMLGNVTKSAEKHVKTRQGANGGTKGSETRKRQAEDRQDYIADQVLAIKAKHPKYSQDRVSDEVLSSWKGPGPKPSRSTLKNDLATLNKSHRTG